MSCLLACIVLSRKSKMKDWELVDFVVWWGGGGGGCLLVCPPELGQLVMCNIQLGLFFLSCMTAECQCE